MIDIPKNKNYPGDAVQCHTCGGNGCANCNENGWLTPKDHPLGRKCEYCRQPLSPANIAVYCSNSCAAADA